MTIEPICMLLLQRRIDQSYVTSLHLIWPFPQTVRHGNVTLPYLYVPIPLCDSVSEVINKRCIDIRPHFVLWTKVEWNTMAPKKSLRSDSATIVKDFGLLDSLPCRPLTRADILGRYNGIRGVLSFKDKLCCSGEVISENKTITYRIKDANNCLVLLTGNY